MPGTHAHQNANRSGREHGCLQHATRQHELVFLFKLYLRPIQPDQGPTHYQPFIERVLGLLHAILIPFARLLSRPALM